jgi:hypothetical protein
LYFALSRVKFFAVLGSAAVTALGAGLVGVGMSRMAEQELREMSADDRKELEAAAASEQTAQNGDGEDKPKGRERIKRS